MEPEKTDSMAAVFDADGPISPSNYGYTACEKWEYPEIVYRMHDEQSWINVEVSCYRGALVLIEGVANGTLTEDVEGVAGIQLFRHYLELALKRIIFCGRMLELADKNAAREEVENVARIHDLAHLWEWVIRDAKPKINSRDWDSYDIAFVEKCVMDFDGIDKKGFAFRYHGHGAESLRFSFQSVVSIMGHVEQVLNALQTYLIETHAQNDEWESIKASW